MKRRIPSPAVSTTQEAWQLRQRLLCMYAENADFRQAVADLHKGHSQFLSFLSTLGEEYAESFSPELLISLGHTVVTGGLLNGAYEEGEAYYHGLVSLVEGWGLHRLPEGMDFVHQHAVALASGDDGWSVGTVLTQESPKVDRKIRLPEDELEWRYQEETAVEARARIIKLVDEQMESVAQDLDKQGWRFPDVRHQEEQHIRWLFRHMALHHKHTDIAHDELGDGSLESSVRQTVYVVAKRCNIRLSDPRP